MSLKLFSSSLDVNMFQRVCGDWGGGEENNNNDENVTVILIMRIMSLNFG